jgi:hypothetical protein
MWGNYYVFTAYKILSAAICIALGIICFGVPFVFDCMSIIFFAVMIVVFKSNKNIIGVCAILLIENLGINLFYSLYIPSFNVDSIIQSSAISITNPLYLDATQSLYWKILGYQAIAISLMFVWHDKLSRSVALLAAVCFAAEVYWATTNYPGPNLHFYLVKACIYLYVRRFLLLRPFYSTDAWRSEMEILRLDWFVTKTMALSVIFEGAMVVEYLIRHLTQYKPIFIYQLYAYFMQAIGVAIVWLVIREAIKLTDRQQLAA